MFRLNTHKMFMCRPVYVIVQTKKHVYMYNEHIFGYMQTGLIGRGCDAMTGGSKETCAGCSMPIDDRFLLRLMESSWHEQCVRCSVCSQPLTTSCFVRDQRIFCRHDYERLAVQSSCYTTINPRTHARYLSVTKRKYKCTYRRA